MAVPVYTLVDSTIALCVPDIKQAILKSSDWAHLQLSTGTQATTLASAAAAAAVSISVAATIPVGSVIVIGNGAANPEVRITTTISGAGPFTAGFTLALVNAYASGAAVGVGSYVKATTTRGSQMVVDLADAAATGTNFQVGVYRTHDGTTAVDKQIRYVRWTQNSLTGSNPIHLEAVAGKEFIYLGAEGPRSGEVGADGGNGSTKQSFALVDIVPYFAGDTVPAVACIGHLSNNVSDKTDFMHVSRNQGNNSSWVPGRLLSLTQPTSISSNPTVVAAQAFAKGDGNTYLWPYVVVEGLDGLRGRLNMVFYAGYVGLPTNTIVGESTLPGGEIVTYNGNTYKILVAQKTNSSTGAVSYNSFGVTSSSSYVYNPQIAVAIG